MRPTNQLNQLNTARPRTSQNRIDRDDIRTARPTARRHSAALRRLALLLSLCLAWSLAIAPCLAAATLRPAPKTGRTLRAALGDHVPSAQRALWREQSRRVALMQARLSRFPYRAYAAARTRPQPAPILPPASAPLSLLDRAGHLARPVPAAEVAAWRKELSGRPPAARAARLHLWLGEWALADQRQPDHAAWQFRQALRLTAHADPLRGAAAFDGALALYYADAYADATDAFRALMSPSAPPFGYDRRTCALWGRMASACAGYHAQHEEAGIPEPTRLDPQCGAAALANACRSLGRPYDKGTILRACRVTGEGSSLQDVLDGARKLGLKAYAVTADDKGLMLLPKPLVAHVERDHFVSVVKADRRGVSYLCSDCGMWPGGRVDLTWRQWHTMNAGNYAAVCLPGSNWDKAIAATLAASPAPATPNAQGLSNAQGMTDTPVRVASLGLGGLLARRPDAGAVRVLMGGLHGHVFPTFHADVIICGSTPADPQPPPVKPRPQPCPCLNRGASVDVSTGEEEHDPDTDLTVYNPHGPSVTWGREYQSLRGNGDGYGGNPILVGGVPHTDVGGDPAYQCADFGPGWTQTYNVGVSDPSAGTDQDTGPDSPKYLVAKDGGKLAFTAASAPTAASPVVHCTPQKLGTTVLLDWDYDASSGHYTATFPDRTQWVTGGLTAGINCFALARIVDRNGHAITFNYGAPANGCHWPLLASITGEDGTALLTIQRATDGSGNVVLVSDCYGREVFYHDGTQANSQVPVPWARTMQLLDHVSQVVPVGTSATPPDRYLYGYTNLSNGNPSQTNPGGFEMVPFLHTCSVPSPTGTGLSTITWNYDPTTDYVSSESDGNGNVTAYAYASNGTMIRHLDSHGNLVYAESIGFDGQMNPTTDTNGAGAVTETPTYADPNDPQEPSAITDANGHTTSYTWDQFGNETSETSARGTVTTDTYSYASFALGELTKTQTGSKTPTSYTYAEPSGLLLSVTRPAPGTAGTGATVTGSTTYDNYGNILTLTRPGNNATSSETTTFNYTTDGSYSQLTAIGEPLTVTDPLGHVAHFRYQESVPFSSTPINRGNVVSQTDALGFQSNITYDIFGNVLTTSLPATGESGSGQATTQTTYLYSGGLALSVATLDESGSVIRMVTATHDQVGNPLSMTGGKEPFSCTYDALYRTRSLTDGGGHTTYYFYNPAGYLCQTCYPGAGSPSAPLAAGTPDTVTYTSYDALGDLLARVDGNGTTTTYTYADPQNLLTNVHYTLSANAPASVSALSDTGCTYDAYGRLAGMTDATGSHATTYDDDDDILRSTTTYTGLPAETISYGYYPDDSGASMTTPAGKFTYTYDAVGREVGLTNPFGESTTWAYQNNDWLASQKTASGTTTTETYDAAGQVTDQKTVIGGSTLADFAVPTTGGYDGEGDRLSVTAGGSLATGTTAYQYDGRSELTQEASNRGSGYTNVNHYDGVTSGTTTGPGNPTTLRSSGPNAFNADNQIAATGSSYDGDGAPVGYKGASLAFDPESRLTAYGSAQADGYTGDGLRAWKQNASGRTYYLYNGTQAVCELSSSGTVTATDTFGENGLVSSRGASGSVFYDFDLSGNVAQRLTSSGSVASSDLTDGFGARRTTDTTGDPFGFGGQWGGNSDAETGLVLMTHREYDPETGRWLTRDPIGHSGGINLYGYCQDQPVNRTDSSGYLGGGRGRPAPPSPAPSFPPVDCPTEADCLNAYNQCLGFATTNDNNAIAHARENQTAALALCTLLGTGVGAGASTVTTPLGGVIIGIGTGAICILVAHTNYEDAYDTATTAYNQAVADCTARRNNCKAGGVF